MYILYIYIYIYIYLRISQRVPRYGDGQRQYVVEDWTHVPPFKHDKELQPFAEKKNTL